jgi:deoxyadenosine/deoxycytidine kinase
MNLERVILCGPSGSGKTTLAKYIADVFKIPFIPGSASLIMTPEDQEELKNKYGYEPTGQKNVINLSGANPNFGYDFQEKLLHNRFEKLFNIVEGFVTDRSPVDNVTYFLNQVVHNVRDEDAEKFIQIATKYYEMTFTHLIYVKCVNPDKIENNGSRVDNKYFQKKVDAIFEHVLKEYFLPIYRTQNKETVCVRASNVKVLTIDYWDLTKRKAEVVQFLTNPR